MKYISLGCFCSIALELEKLGLREESSPFDWLITDLSGVIDAMETHFKDLWTYAYWAQNTKNRAYYKHLKYGFEFFHDFDCYRPFSEQVSQVKEKYDRRIRRFYESIQEPTLFIRYISSEAGEGGVSKELVWIEENYDRILRVIKACNQESELLLIANRDVVSSRVKIYHVDRDANDTVARFPLRKNPELREYFTGVDYPNRRTNLRFYALNRGKRLMNKVKRKARKLAMRLTRRKYCHETCY